MIHAQYTPNIDSGQTETRMAVAALADDHDCRISSDYS